jgi:antitoxin ParD1/3/4
MTTMNISLPDELKQFVDDQVASRGFGTSSEYVRELLRREQDRLQLRQLVLDGILSGRGKAADAKYFASLRQKALRTGRTTTRKTARNK